MTKQQVDFNSNSKEEKWYDIYEDWDLIEASFVKQYGIRLRKLDLSWKEFSTLLIGIMPDTPLGQIINIRSETDAKTIKQFNPSQKKIYNDWKLKRANEKLKNPEQLSKEMFMLEKSMEFMFGGNNK